MSHHPMSQAERDRQSTKTVGGAMRTENKRVLREGTVKIENGSQYQKPAKVASFGVGVTDSKDKR